ncbi:hypothetical protein [Devosia chinhatensis]|uniref:hypothetical protein n=1 Tax=Devosia chinhatensis TaxID=429727 RepID=UPI000A6C20F7|nr:hypothetical protein [Devosia chinhatensis]
MTRANVLTLAEVALSRAAARSSGALSTSRLRQILRGASPEGNERFVFQAVLASGTIGERRQLAAAAGISWGKFASRFQALTGIHRDRAGSATSS